MPPRILRRFDVDPGYAFASYAERQKLYLDRDARVLRPDTQVWCGGVLEMSVNGLGCKGPDPEPGRPLIAFFGDSATMGNGFTPDSWPLHVEVPGFAILNAAVEGADMNWAAWRFERLTGQVDISCAVVHVGWENLIHNDTNESHWEEVLRRFVGNHVTAFCTIAPCVSGEFDGRGIRALLNTDGVDAPTTRREAEVLDAGYFSLWGGLRSEGRLQPLLEMIARFNACVRRVADESKSVLIDLHAFLTPTRYEDAPRDFFDVRHLRPRAYEKVGRHVAAQLATVPLRPVDPGKFRMIDSEDAEDLRRQIYTLW